MVSFHRGVCFYGSFLGGPSSISSCTFVDSECLVEIHTDFLNGKTHSRFPFIEVC